MRSFGKVLSARSAPRVVNGVRHALPLMMGGLCLWLAAQQIDVSDLMSVPARMATVGPVAWGLALVLTLISLMAAGRYDVIALRHMRRPVAAPDAQRSGMVAIALAQATGFAPIVATYARWRQLPGLGFGAALATGVFSALSFLFGLAAFLGLLSLIPGIGLSPLMGVGIGVFVLSIVLTSALRPPGLARLNNALPSLPALGAILVWTGIDLLAAAGVLWVLLPPGSGIDYLMLLPIFSLAIGAAIVTSVPGALGPFELVCLTLLPMVPAGDVLAAVIGYRLVYIALPACLAVILLARPRPFRPTPLLRQAPWARDLLPAECRLSEASGAGYSALGAGAAALQETPQSVVAMFGMVGPAPPLDPLIARARSVGKLALLYRIDARLAVSVRAAHWRVLRVAREALIHPAFYDLSLPGRRRLRRKLSRFARSGGIVDQPSRIALSDLRPVQRAWEAHHGAERGFTMGRFSRAHLSGQAIFVARHAGRIVGFASFHVTRSELCLDLLRPLPGAPDGCGFALVQAAIDAAARAGIPRVSLAAVPRALPFMSAAHSGLFQFKDAFCPVWVPRYASAPNWVSLVLALSDVLRENTWPSVPAPPDIDPPHDFLENYEIARGFQPCQP